jgi:hypothetical protein
MKQLISFKNTLLLAVALTGMFTAKAQEQGLLFYLSGNEGLRADYAAGDPVPNYVSNISAVSDGAQGQGIHCGHAQLLSYWAPKNIYAQRGTLSFYWRPSWPVDETPFPVFRVAYADHSSWDMVWSRIDWNGHGFDAFVTDINLARIRVSFTMSELPAPDQWIHLSLTWDETQGIRFYVNGQKVGEKSSAAVLNAGLDQFGPHSRIISPYQVQSMYNFIRGGDIDEVRIYDQALPDGQIMALAKGNAVNASPVKRDLSQKEWSDEWNLRYGWNRAGDMPPYLENTSTTIRKVQILEAYDIKRWWWKANDGIRETTWPGVFNHSRIAGRADYFILPDWDCYTLSGKNVRFNMPDEKWNYLEISSGADGKIALTPNKDGSGGKEIFTRAKGNERTFHKLGNPVQGQTIVFTNNEQENPVGELDAFYIHEGDVSQDVTRLTYSISAQGNYRNPNIREIQDYIYGRYSADEISLMLASPMRSAPSQRQEAKNTQNRLPLIHIVIPSDFRSIAVGTALDKGNIARGASYTWHNMDGGLDGIRITLPAMSVKPVSGGLFPVNIQVKDPVWPLRNMMDVSFSVKPDEERILWLDMRDRILPNDKPLYLTIAGGGADFNTNLLEGAKIELIFKDRKEAAKEHVADRFTQVRDNHAMIVEEHPSNRRLNKYVQIEADMTDLLAVDPHHKEGREYWYSYNPEQPRPKTEIAPAPQGIPAWAHLQLEYLKEFRHFVEWQIDHRQIENGEFGGGLSDDSDFGNFLPALALMGVIPDKLDNSLGRMMEIIVKEGMMTKGMSTIQTDGLHTFEEGTNVVGELNLLRMGAPREVERLMECAYAVKHYITGVDKAGHTHFRSDFFGADRMASGIWAWSFPWAGLHMIPVIYMAEFYGNPQAKQLVIDIADGYLAHARVTPDGKVMIDSEISFYGDTSRPSGSGSTGPLLWAAWKLTGNSKYIKPLLDQGEAGMRGVTSNMLDLANLRSTFGKNIISGVTPDNGSDFARHIAWQMTGDKKYLEGYCTDLIANARVRNYINTEGMMWTDRLSFSSDLLQRSRMGGTASARNQIYPGNTVSWKFDNGDIAEKVAILVPFATQKEFEVEFFNTENQTVRAYMTGADVLGGQWHLSYGADTNGDGRMDKESGREKVSFGRNETVTLSIPPHSGMMIKMKLAGKGAMLSNRTDLAIGREDVRREGDKIYVTVHNLGSVSTPKTQVALVDRNKKAVATTAVPALASAADMLPKRVEVILTAPQGIDPENLDIVIDPKDTIREISKKNNIISLSIK